MGLIVQKFGGTSVGSVERILNVANRVIEEKRTEMTLLWLFLQWGRQQMSLSI